MIVLLSSKNEGIRMLQRPYVKFSEFRNLWELWAVKKTLNGPFLSPHQLCPSEPWDWHRLLGCNVNTLRPTSDFECLSSSSQQGRQGLSCTAEAQSITSSSLNCSGCPNTWRCSSRALMVLRSWLVHRSSLVVMGLAGRSRGAGCWLQQVLISGNFPPSDLIFNCN